MTTPNTFPLEIELKFGCPPELRQQLETHPAFHGPSVQGPKTARQVSTYYDTPANTLGADGLTLRVRASDGKRARVQTLKSTTNGNGVAASRGEWEWGIRSEHPDTTLLLGTPAAGHVLNELEPMVVTDIRRTTWLLSLEGGTVVEAALDEGTIAADGSKCPVHELELELKKGSLAPFYRLALVLHADLKLRIEPEAKSTRGFRLRTERPPKVRKTPKPVLHRDISGIEGFRQILAQALGALVANISAAASGDPEGIHQMRIAVRRLRTALVLFKPQVRPGATTRFEDELRRLGQILGEARDWDVFTLSTLSASLKRSQRSLVEPTAEDARQSALHRLREELAHPSLTGLILSLAAWAEDELRIANPTARSARLADLAPALLDRMAKKVRRRGRHIAKLSGPDLHRVRKSLKKLRYAADDLGSLFPRKAVKSFGKQCAGMQDELGTINDAAMAVTLAESLARDGQPGHVAATAAITRWSDKRRRKASRKLPEDWKDLRQASPFWR